MMIELKNVSKRYDGEVVLSDFSARIPCGACTCVLGPSGRGKTTLFRMLMGLETPDAGEIIGMDCLVKSTVFQEDRLCENLDACTNILLPHIHKNSTLTRGEIVQGLDAMGLSDISDKLVRELSGGMKRRVAVLRALLAPHDILFLDEPFKGLDEKAKRMTMDYVKMQSKGKTIVCITHDEAEVSYLAPTQVISL